MTAWSLRCRMGALAAAGAGAANLTVPVRLADAPDLAGCRPRQAAKRLWWLPIVNKPFRCDEVFHKNAVTKTQKMVELEKGVDFKAIMSQSEFFGEMKKDVFTIAEQVGHKMWFRKGSVILEQGELNDRLFLVGLGKLSVAMDEQKVATLTKGDCFGESACMMKQKAGATVKVVSDQALLFAIGHDELQDALPPAAWEKLAELANERDLQNLSYTFLKEVPVFAQASTEFLQSCVKSLKFVTFEEGTQILTMGIADAQGMFFIKTGELGIYDNHGQIATLKDNDCVGETMLLAGSTMKRGCTARSLSFVEAYQLSKKDFAVLANKYPKDFEAMKNVSKDRIRKNLSRATRVRHRES